MDSQANKAATASPVKVDRYSEELFAKIKAENITVAPAVWSLMTHILGNRAYAISLITGDYLSLPKWILKSGSRVMQFLYRVSGHKDNVGDLEYSLLRTKANALQIKEFLTRLREATDRKGGFKEDAAV